MKTLFKIAKYVKEGDSFTKSGYDEYTITYLIATKNNYLRIVVNGYLTKHKINITDFRQGYKNQILLAIQEYKKLSDSSKYTKVTNKVSLEYIRKVYSGMIVSNVENYLLTINKEESRDKLTQFELI